MFLYLMPFLVVCVCITGHSSLDDDDDVRFLNFSRYVISIMFCYWLYIGGMKKSNIVLQISAMQSSCTPMNTWETHHVWSSLHLPIGL